MTGVPDQLIDRARTAVTLFIDRAALAQDPKAAVDWSLAARNMAAVVHSLIGAQATSRRGA
jgi:hypothetical protein